MTLNIYRSNIEWVTFESKRETSVKFSEIESIKLFGNYLIKFETFNKIDLYFLPKNTSESKQILNKITENAKNFLGLEIDVKNLEFSELTKFMHGIKLKLFSFKVYRIIYNAHKEVLNFIGDNDYFYEFYENQEGIITRVNKIAYVDIMYIINHETGKIQ